MNNKTLFIDFFGVICSEIAPFWLVKYFSDNEAVAIKQTIVADADVGNISQEDMFNELSKLTGKSGKQIENEWKELVKIDIEILDFINEYKRTQLVLLLTNASSNFVRDILQDYSLYKYFNDVFISSEERIAKPNPEFYNNVLRKTNINPNNVIMIDDNIKNVESAISVGIEGILYSTINELKTCLNKLK